MQIKAIEVHAEGEPGRVIIDGMPDLPGRSVFEKMRHMQTHLDHIRLLMLREPRGHPALCCNVIVPPCDPRADAGVIIMEQTEYPPMSGSNLICTVTALLETGMLTMQEPLTSLTLETPAGLIRVTARCASGKVTRVTFQNVPAFALHLDAELDVPGHGKMRADIAWGGMFFVIAKAESFGLTIEPGNGAALVRICEALRHAAADQFPVHHPENPTLTGPTISQLTGPPPSGADGQSAVSVSTGPFRENAQGLSGILDRSPCGTGTCAKMATLHARGLLDIDQDYINAGPLGTTFTGRITGLTRIGPYDAIQTTLSGQAWIYGESSYRLDATDPFQNGMAPGDIWG